MPYTLLHPGLVAPLYRKWPSIFSWIGLFVGSIVPDLDIIYRFTETRYHIFSYSIQNILTVLIPIGIVLSYYFESVWVPISQQGKLDLSTLQIKKVKNSFLKILFSVAIGIAIHLFWDQFAHFDDTSTLATQIKNDLGYEKDEFSSLETILIYTPQLFISGISLFMCLYYLFHYRKTIKIQLSFLIKHIKTTCFLFTLITICFTSMKIIKAGVENYLILDSIIIGITCGLVSAVLLTPLLLWLFLLSHRVSHVLIYLSTWILTLYNFGLPQKEYLSIYIFKEILLIILSSIIFLLFRKNILQEIDIKKKQTLLIMLVLSILSNIAFYSSGKGISPGIIAISAISILIVLQHFNTFNLKTKWIFFLDKIFIVALIAPIHPLISMIATIAIAISFLMYRFSKLLHFNFKVYIIILPILSVVYIFFTFSKMYGAFAFSQFMIVWLYLYSNFSAPKEVEPISNEAH